MWALIQEGAVSELTEIDPDGRFHHSLRWEPADAMVQIGDLYDGQAYSRPVEPLEGLATSAQRRINDGYTATLAAILDQYPDAETLSFDKQEREARTWGEWQEIGGTEPATPYLDAMLAERPIGKAELVGRIITKADAFVAAHGNATGRRQRLEDDIKAARQAEDRAALEAIDW